MKRVGYLFEKIVDYNNIYKAIIEASKNKKNKKTINKIFSN